MQKFDERETVTGLKKTYSVLSQAYANIRSNEGLPKSWDVNSPDEFRDLFAKYLLNSKKCDANSGQECQSNVVKTLNSSSTTDYSRRIDHSSLILNDGSSLTFYYNASINPRNCDYFDDDGYSNYCDGMAIHVDVNGFKGPNVWGRDRFQFGMTSDKILPSGFPTSSSFNDNCKNGTNSTGTGCAAWVIYNENMDYLHCDDLSWDGKQKCD